MNRLTFCLLLFLTGCYFGDRSAVRIVSLRLSVQTEANNTTAPETEIQEALKMIDGVLVSSGLTQIPTPQAGHSDGAIRHYRGPPTRGCSVSIRDQRLLIVFLEFGERNSSEPVKRICGSLEKELQGRYGSKRVRIETRY